MSCSDTAACWRKVWLGTRWTYYIKPAFTYLSVSHLVALLSLWRDIFGGYEMPIHYSYCGFFNIVFFLGPLVVFPQENETRDSESCAYQGHIGATLR